MSYISNAEVFCITFFFGQKAPEPLRLLPSAKSTSLCTREALNRSYPAKISARMTPSAATRRFMSVSMLSLIPAVSALMVIVAQPLTGML